MKGTLELGETHPAAWQAQRWIASLHPLDLIKWQDAFASCSIENNRLAEICSETLNRLIKGESVSDRYLLGLVWVMRFSTEFGK